jgi:hypothetical protein
MNSIKQPFISSKLQEINETITLADMQNKEGIEEKIENALKVAGVFGKDLKKTEIVKLLDDVLIEFKNDLELTPEEFKSKKIRTNRIIIGNYFFNLLFAFLATVGLVLVTSTFSGEELEIFSIFDTASSSPTSDTEIEISEGFLYAIITIISVLFWHLADLVYLKLFSTQKSLPLYSKVFNIFIIIAMAVVAYVVPVYRTFFQNSFDRDRYYAFFSVVYFLFSPEHLGLVFIPTLIIITFKTFQRITTS